MIYSGLKPTVATHVAQDRDMASRSGSPDRAAGPNLRRHDGRLALMRGKSMKFGGEGLAFSRCLVLGAATRPGPSGSRKAVMSDWDCLNSGARFQLDFSHISWVRSCAFQGVRRVPAIPG